MLDLDLTYRRGDFTLAARFAAGPGLTAITGPSGAGKTTLLNLIAGLLRPHSGDIRLDGTALTDLPPHRRRIGYVFQEARLFPHLSVRQNLRYGRLFTHHPAPAPAPATLADITDLLDIGPLLDRRPRDLSGGEKQRVAIGRALLAAPRLILLDEPLAALDAARKAELLPYLARLHDQTRLPMLYVTHHPGELRGLAGGWLRVEGGMATPAPAPDQ
ncbi:ATP-binding cassette domain-containing protein [Niveispirillum sp. SYP-B3756]|uniref:ATP-binding cassette domain-containing protein n=1 Tax=Niveispirillum sp. SYP-B3756 TaxID=2662178 RepID=UPI0012921398|nr:ATP-binding cassette domain-containing protein [Niveispirillum sp. SYP-B3756]MQP66873.1 ATP-binding cassette domain-containing protein [Niveispirillum sp. SYP-B3756]